MIQIIEILGTAAPVSVTMIEASGTSERLLQPDRPWTHLLREGTESQGGSQWIPELPAARETAPSITVLLFKSVRNSYKLEF